MSDAREMRIYFPDEGMTYSLLVTPLGDDRYRLEESSIFVDVVGYGDILNVVKQPNGRFYFQGVVGETMYNTYTLILSKSTTDLPQFESLISHVRDEGGNWEIRFGGVITLNVPKSSAYDPGPELESLKQLDREQE